jgi:dTDP-4-amino-4,6-dideoxygalactose transaminase
MSQLATESLAIRGGQPVRTKPFPTWPVFGKPEEDAVLRCLRSGKWGKLDGDQVKTFERRFADMHQAKHAIAVVNGTVSLKIALMAAGIRGGDDVIVRPYTFLATATAVVEANATPVFVDIERDTFNIDPKKIEAAITPKTRAIIVVHLGGLPVDLDAIMAIAKKHNLTVIEDAAHAHAAEYKGRKVGAIGHMGSFSFQSSKNLTSGEGGLITTNDDRLADMCRSIHNCGRLAGGAWYEHHIISANYRLNEWAGAILNCQLDRFDQQTRTRDTTAKYLDKHLSQIPGITPQKRSPDCTLGAYHLYLFRYDQGVFGVPRARFLEALAKEGIPASPGYVIPLYKQPLFLNRQFGPYSGCNPVDLNKLQLPVADNICSTEGAWLYQSLLLGTQKDLDDIIHAFQKLHDHRAALT